MIASIKNLKVLFSRNFWRDFSIKARNALILNKPMLVKRRSLFTSKTYRPTVKEGFLPSFTVGR